MSTWPTFPPQHSIQRMQCKCSFYLSPHLKKFCTKRKKCKAGIRVFKIWTACIGSVKTNSVLNRQRLLCRFHMHNLVVVFIWFTLFKCHFPNMPGHFDVMYLNMPLLCYKKVMSVVVLPLL